VKEGVSPSDNPAMALPALEAERGFAFAQPRARIDARLRRFYPMASRVLDVAVSLAALILAAPVILLAVIAIKATSTGPVFFRQRRAGKDQVPFTMYKLRTMYPGADDDKELFRKFNSLPTGPCFKMKNDPRVTPVGRWLRRSSLDELPQFLNALKGDMALVGPRPLPLDEVVTDTPQQRMRFTVKPGITCLWQVCGRTEIPYAEWLALDVWYVLNRSLSLDLQILCKTFPAVLSGRGAY
jgi:lipopolysaccharide/colanic/teichoic acid biosynthesis glycosyltransferase